MLTPKRSITKLILKGAVIFDVVSYQFRCALNYSKLVSAQTPSEVQRMRRVPYASAIGSIMYATAVKTILKYLRNTKDMVLVYGAKPEAKLKVSCAKQSTTSMSSTKAEYIVAAEASMEAVWMRKFIDGLSDVVPSNKRPMEMLCYNEPAIVIANDPGILKGARYFQRKYHYIREVIQEREIVLKRVHTDDNVAGPFTKPMPFNKHDVSSCRSPLSKSLPKESVRYLLILGHMLVQLVHISQRHRYAVSSLMDMTYWM
ncbi:hypothetical protein Tco_1226066 [Tanacetum coccineum]